MIEQHCDAEAADKCRTTRGDRRHDAPAVEPVGKGATQQGEEEPGEALGEGEPCDQRRVMREGGSQERGGDEHDAIAEVRGRAGGPELAKLRPKTGLHGRTSGH